MDVSQQPLVSVVTPVYNGENFITECIESVLAQTYQNWEYVIVNNCSTDRTPEIIKEYVNRDERIRIYHNDDFLTSIQNQSHALKQISAESKYCKVVHADDWLFPKCIAEMVKLAEMDSSIGVVGSYMLQGNKIVCDGLPPPEGNGGCQYPVTIMSGRDVCRFDIYGAGRPSVFGCPSTLLIRSDIIRDKDEQFYDEQHLFADRDVCYKILQNSNFGFIYQVLSFMRQHEGQEHSIMHRVDGWIACRFYLLKKYGRIYLSKNEYQELLDKKLYEYYNFIKYNSLRRFRLEKEDPFWKYHLKYLNLSGYPLSSAKIVRYAFAEMLDIVLNPKRAIELAWKKLFAN